MYSVQLFCSCIVGVKVSIRHAARLVGLGTVWGYVESPLIFEERAMEGNGMFELAVSIKATNYVRACSASVVDLNPYPNACS